MIQTCVVNCGKKLDYTEKTQTRPGRIFKLYTVRVQIRFTPGAFLL